MKVFALGLFAKPLTDEQRKRILLKAFDLGESPDFRLRYNVSPTQQVLAIRLNDGKRQARFHRWGLIPSWADDPSISYRMINARAETVADKPSYHGLISCLADDRQSKRSLLKVPRHERESGQTPASLKRHHEVTVAHRATNQLPGVLAFTRQPD
jgi:hypothetical protein